MLSSDVDKLSRVKDPEPRGADPHGADPHGADPHGAERSGDDLKEGDGLPFEKLSGMSRLENEEREDRKMKSFFRDPAKVNGSLF